MIFNNSFCSIINSPPILFSISVILSICGMSLKFKIKSPGINDLSKLVEKVYSGIGVKRVPGGFIFFLGGIGLIIWFSDNFGCSTSGGESDICWLIISPSGVSFFFIFEGFWIWILLLFLLLSIIWVSSTSFSYAPLFKVKLSALDWILSAWFLYNKWLLLFDFIIFELSSTSFS